MKHMKPPYNTKAVLFDMDGVIFNTEDISHEVFSELAKEFGCVMEEKLHVAIMGTTELVWSKYFCTVWSLSIRPQEFAEKYWIIQERIEKENLQIMPGVVPLLTELKKTDIRTALVTSTPIEHVENQLNKFNLKQYFTIIITGDQVEKGKPDPEPYLTAIEKLGLKSTDCVVIEDAISGVESGKSAGCYVIAVPTVHAKSLDYSEADCVINSLEEISGL